MRQALRVAVGRFFAWRSEAAEFALARRWFAQGLGLIFLIAFVSLAVQVQGLMGTHGIAPAAEFLELARRSLGASASWQCPTLFWLGAGDAALLTACWAGAAISLLLAAGRLAAPCCLLLWALYLSLCSVGSPFLDFQWDALLLETALPAAVFLPWRWRPDWGRVTTVQRIGRWLLWWLAGRLMLESAIVKLSSDDPTWRGLSAMTFHYETQPLPLPAAWYAHHTPLWVHQAEVLATFAIEFLAPLGILAARPFRHAAAAAIVLLQAAIAATGNYAFFNLLTALLAVPLLDDGCFPAPWRPWWHAEAKRVPSPPASTWAIASLAIVSVLVTGERLIGTLRAGWSPPEPLRSLSYEWLAPLRSFNSYGLFAVMTTSRLEIEVQGSLDGINWQTYEFRWKPGDIRRRPSLVAPHQPRLDWQMWFAALGSYRQNAWFIRFLERLLEGSPEVLALLERNPFPGHPPAYVRAVAYEYRYTETSGSAWWRREVKGLYCPVLSLRERTDGGSP